MRFFDQIGDQRVQHPPDSLVHHDFVWCGRGRGERGVVECAEQRRSLANLAGVENARVEAVVEVGGQVGNLVGQIDQLGLQRRKLAEKILGQLGVAGQIVVARVLHNPLADGQRQIQPAKGRIALLEPGDDAQRVQVVVEAEAVRAKGAVEGLLAGMAEGRMPEVVRQRKRLGQLRIQPQRRSHGARDLRHLERVREAAAEVVGEPFGGQAGKDLGLAGETAKGARMQDAGGIARKRSAVGVRRLGVGAGRQRAVQSAVRGDPRGQWDGEFNSQRTHLRWHGVHSVKAPRRVHVWLYRKKWDAAGHEPYPCGANHGRMWHVACTNASLLLRMDNASSSGVPSSRNFL